MIQAAMPARFVNIDHDTPLLLPPDLRDWLPKDHLVHFIIDAVAQVDVSSAKINEHGTGSAQYPPAMMMSLLIFCYATGNFSSRKIERLSYESVAVRYLCADTHPDHDSICTFRRANKALFTSLFHQVLEMAARSQVLRVGDITLSLDGTKIFANASKHSAVSHGHIVEQLKLLEEQIDELVAKAENADSTPLQDGLSIPAEPERSGDSQPQAARRASAARQIERREDRIAKLKAAKAVIEERAKERIVKEKAEHETKLAERAAKEARTGKKPGGRAPQAPSEEPAASDQMNFTDPESRIMPVSGSKDFEQCYNAQAAVEVESRLIIAAEVVQAPNDKEQLVPGVAAVSPVIRSIANVLADSGYNSEAAVKQVEQNAAGKATGTTVYAATKRNHHQRSVRDLEQHDDPPAPPPEASASERMAHRTSTAAGRALYKLRQQTIEPVFGIIKSAMGFRRLLRAAPLRSPLRCAPGLPVGRLSRSARLSMRGLEKASLEWTLVSTSYNLKRLFNLKAQLKAA
jgi:transposase